VIVLIETKNGAIKKAFVRNAIFHEVKDDNRKEDPIQTGTIDSVYWLDAAEGKSIIKWPIKKWLEAAEASEYFGMAG